MRRLVWILSGILIVAVVVYVASTQLGSDDGEARSSASDAVPTKPSRTAPVPAPSGGSADETVAPGQPVTTVDAGSKKEISLSDGVAVRIDNAKIVPITGVGPGQRSGPAAAVKVTITNGSSKPINPGSAVVTLLRGNSGEVASPTTASPADPFSGAVQPDQSAQGTYVFEVPNGKLDVADVVVQYQTGREAVRFQL